MFLTSGVADMLAFAKAVGVSPADAASLFEHFNPGAQIAARAKRVLEADFVHPSWELSMARKDARLMMDESKLRRRSPSPSFPPSRPRWTGGSRAVTPATTGRSSPRTPSAERHRNASTGGRKRSTASTCMK